MPWSSVEAAVEAIGRGEIVVVVDDEDRENEGDLIVAAEFATPEKMAFFVRHTSASLLIQENADPDVRDDIQAFFARLVPPANDPAMSYLTHRAEGLDDMPAHIKSALTQTSVSIPIGDGHLMLGTWQGLYLFEHRHHPHRREVVLHAGL